MSRRYFVHRRSDPFSSVLAISCYLVLYCRVFLTLNSCDLASLAFTNSKFGRSTRPPFMNTVYITRESDLPVGSFDVVLLVVGVTSVGTIEL